MEQTTVQSGKKVEKVSSTFVLGGKEVDARKGLPMTLGQLRHMKAKYGVGLQDIGVKMDAEQYFALAMAVFTKANAELTEADVETLKINDLMRLGQVVNESFLTEEVDRPT
jgi:hypothetical protein